MFKNTICSNLIGTIWPETMFRGCSYSCFDEKKNKIVCSWAVDVRSSLEKVHQLSWQQTGLFWAQLLLILFFGERSTIAAGKTWHYFPVISESGPSILYLSSVRPRETGKSGESPWPQSVSNPHDDHPSGTTFFLGITGEPNTCPHIAPCCSS